MKPANLNTILIAAVLGLLGFCWNTLQNTHEAVVAMQPTISRLKEDVTDLRKSCVTRDEIDARIALSQTNRK